LGVADTRQLAFSEFRMTAVLDSILAEIKKQASFSLRPIAKKP
jgi:hypothetical protein